jgi:hypothetical protein
MAEKSKPILLPKGKKDDTKDDEDFQDAQSPAIADITVQPGSLLDNMRKAAEQAQANGTSTTGDMTSSVSGGSGSMTRSTPGANKEVGTKPKRPTPKPADNEDIDPEDPILQEEHSDDEDPEPLFGVDQSLLDPEEEGTEVNTLAAIFPSIELTQEDLDKDPELNPDRINELTGLRSPGDLDAYRQYYRALCRHRRKIYLHAGLLQKKLIGKKYTSEDLEGFLFYAENSKRLLDFIHTKLVNMYDITGGQKRSFTVGMKNLVRGITFLAKEVNSRQEAMLEQQAKAARKAEDEREKALSQIQALNAARADRQTVESTGNLPPTVHHSTPNGPRTGRLDDPPNRYVTYGATASSRGSLATHTTRGHPRERRGSSRGGYGAPFRDDRSFEHSTSDESGPNTVTMQALVEALKCLKSGKTDSPDYRGLDKPKLEFFSGDASVYAHWKKKFLLAHEGRNLPDAYLANTLHTLLKGEARAKVEVHFTADWTGENYQQMWTLLDDYYGSRHIQDRCIQDRAARIIPLHHENLNSVAVFYDEITVQVNYYLTHKPSAVYEDNSFLYQQIRQKIGDKIMAKFADWADMNSTEEEDLPPRSILTLQKYLHRRAKLLREIETFSSSARHKASRSPIRSSINLTEDQGDGDSDSSTDSEPEIESTVLYTTEGRKVYFDPKKNKVHKYKPYEGERKQVPYTGKQRKFRPMDKVYEKSFETFDKACPICGEPEIHELVNCPKFLKLITVKRYAIVRLSKTCFHCLQRGHPMQSCKNRLNMNCGVGGCKRYEHPLLHADDSTRKIPYSDWNDVTHGELVWEEGDGDIPESLTMSVVMRLAEEGEIGVQTAVCQLSDTSGKHRLRTCIMLDSGATHTYIDEDIAFDLHLKQVSNPRVQKIGGFFGSGLAKTWRVELTLTSHDGMLTHTFFASTKKDLTVKTGVVDWSKYKKNFDFMKDIPFVPLPKNPRIAILAGGDQAHLFECINGTSRGGGPRNPIVYCCPLGWVGFGPSVELPEDVAEKVDQLMVRQIPRNK